MGKHSEPHPVKEKHVSRFQSGGTCACQEGSKKRMRVYTEEEEDNASWVESGVDASHRKIRRDSERHRDKHKIFKKKHTSRTHSKIDASQRKVKRRPHVLNPKGPYMRTIRLVLSSDKWMKRMLAKAALKFYEKSQGVKFEIVEPLYFQSSILSPPGSRSDGKWCHSSFIAKPKYSDSSPEYFFAEFLQSERSSKFHVKYCSTFEPSDNPGFNHKCMFCPPLQKFHPDKGYYAGTEGWRAVEYAWV